MVLFRDMGDQGQQQREAWTTQKGQELQRWLSKPWRRGHASEHSLRAAEDHCSPCSCQPEKEKRCILPPLLKTCERENYISLVLELCLVSLLWNRENIEALGDLKWVSSAFLLRYFSPLLRGSHGSRGGKYWLLTISLQENPQRWRQRRPRLLYLKVIVKN